MKDLLIRGIDNTHNFRIFACSTTALSEEARKLHNLWPTSAAALSRVMSVGIIMGANLKGEDERINIEIDGGGPIGKILVDVRSNGTIRGYVGEPKCMYEYNDTHKLAVGVAVGTNGYLRVTKGLGLKADFSGEVELQTGEIGEDFAYYYTVSEQCPSAVSVGCLVDTDDSIMAAGGLVLQVLPEATDEDITYMEQALGRLKPVSEMIHSGMSLEDILAVISDTIEILETKEVRWECGCSKEKTSAALATLSNADRQEMIDEDHGCEVVCHFCNTHYQFTEEDLKAMNEANQ